VVVVAVRVSFVFGALRSNAGAVSDGAELAIVTVFDCLVPSKSPSFGVASTVTTSCLLGLIELGGLAPVQALVE
jgi:hypothetical protein